MIGEGTPANPYRENPPTRFVEVHWGGTQAVKWREGQILYIERAVADVLDGTKGVCAFWLRGIKPKSPLVNFTGFLVDIGAGQIGFSAGTPADEIALEQFWASNFFGGPDAPATVFYNAYDCLPELERWYHVYMEWDVSGYAPKIAVNGKPVGIETIDDYFGMPGPPFVVPWKTPPSDDAINASGGSYHTHLVFFWQASDIHSLTGDPAYSVAEFWLDLDTYGIGPEKFVDVATGLPKPLGAHGELPTGSPPKFYFSRRGPPDTFLVNRGSAGEVHLSRTIGGGLPVDARPIVLPEDGPLAEPAAPHFTPDPIPLVA